MSNRNKSDYLAAQREMVSNAAKRADEQREREARILGALPDDLAFYMIHPHKLYGSVGSVAIGSKFQRYGEDDDRLTWAEIGDLIERFPPSPLVLHRDGCVGFRPAAFKDPRDENRNPTITPVFPVTMRLDAFHGFTSCKVLWYTERDGVRFEFDVVSKEPAANISVVRTGPQSWGDKRPIERCDLVSPNVWVEHHIRYASGSPENPNQFTLYWSETDTPPHVYWGESILSGARAPRRTPPPTHQR